MDHISRLLSPSSGVGTAGAVLGALALAVVIPWLAHAVYQWYRLSHIPGPFWAAFSKWWMVRESLKGRQPTAIKEVTDKYGEFVKNMPLSDLLCHGYNCCGLRYSHASRVVQARWRASDLTSWSPTIRKSCAG